MNISEEMYNLEKIAFNLGGFKQTGESTKKMFAATFTYEKVSAFSLNTRTHF